MSKAIASEIVTFTIDGNNVTAKVEDASKSESILAKVESSQSPRHITEQVNEFDRSLLAKT